MVLMCVCVCFYGTVQSSASCLTLIDFTNFSSSFAKMSSYYGKRILEKNYAVPA